MYQITILLEYTLEVLRLGILTNVPHLRLEIESVTHLVEQECKPKFAPVFIETAPPVFFPFSCTFV